VVQPMAMAKRAAGLTILNRVLTLFIYVFLLFSFLISFQSVFCWSCLRLNTLLRRSLATRVVVMQRARRQGGFVWVWFS
jgi:hypothetical protein